MSLIDNLLGIPDLSLLGKTVISAETRLARVRITLTNQGGTVTGLLERAKPGQDSFRGVTRVEFAANVPGREKASQIAPLLQTALQLTQAKGQLPLEIEVSDPRFKTIRLKSKSLDLTQGDIAQFKQLVTYIEKTTDKARSTPA